MVGENKALWTNVIRHRIGCNGGRDEVDMLTEWCWDFGVVIGFDGFDEFNEMVYRPVLGFSGSERIMLLFLMMWAWDLWKW